MHSQTIVVVFIFILFTFHAALSQNLTRLPDGSYNLPHLPTHPKFNDELEDFNKMATALHLEPITSSTVKFSLEGDFERFTTESTTAFLKGKSGLDIRYDPSYLASIKPSDGLHGYDIFSSLRLGLMVTLFFNSAQNVYLVLTHIDVSRKKLSTTFNSFKKLIRLFDLAFESQGLILDIDEFKDLDLESYEDMGYSYTEDGVHVLATPEFVIEGPKSNLVKLKKIFEIIKALDNGKPGDRLTVQSLIDKNLKHYTDSALSVVENPMSCTSYLDKL